MTTASVRLIAVMTLPRWECTAARTQIESALRQIGIPLMTAQGVFYGQCMTRIMESAIEQGAEWILTIDGDSWFTADQLRHLMTVFHNRTDIDALAALQARRGARLPLLSVGSDKDGFVEIDRNPLQVATAHFGLTLLRTSAIKQMGRPWFWAQPDPDGGWGEGRVDEDIYFWQEWAAANNTLYILPTCRIGHLEEMVSLIGSDGKTTHVYPSDFTDKE